MNTSVGISLRAPGVPAAQRLRGEHAARLLLEALNLEAWELAQASKSAMPHVLAAEEAQAAVRLIQVVALEACYGSGPWPATARLDLSGALH